MVWDLRGALLKKAELETARLLDFEFRHRVRTMRLLAAELDMDGDDLVRLIVLEADEAILKDLVGKTNLTMSELQDRFKQCATRARAELVAELGDPQPYRMA